MIKKTHPHVYKALQYVDDVLDGKIPACQWTKLACQRQRKDIKRKFSKKKWPYIFDLDKAEKVCKFFELFVHVKGKWAGTNIVLEPWQCFYLTTKYGWVYRDSGYRRFTTSYFEVPRKNAKSTLSSIEELFMASADGEPGAECYSAATTKSQARIVFDVARSMASKSLDFINQYNVRVKANTIEVGATESVIAPVSAQAGNLDGLNIHFASVDELHAHKTRAVYDVIETGCGAREQSMLSIITTAGTDIKGICYELRNYLTKILQGLPGFDDESFFGIIYTIDEDDDWTSELAFRKANPNYGVSVKPEMLQRLAKKASRSMSSQANFKTKHLNVWEKSDSAWMNMMKWKRCHSIMKPRPTLEDLKGKPCYVGLDASTKLDVTALMLLFNVDGIWLPYGKYYLPEDTVEERAATTHNHYSGWAKEGRFTLTPGDVIDYNYIMDDIREICEQFEVVSVGYDPWQTTQLATTLLDEGVPMVEIGANVRNFSEPMKELESLVVARKIDHGNDPVLTWMISNVVGHFDKKDNIYPNKERPEDKIDGVIALIMALSRAILGEENFESVYNTRGIVTA